jgi:hypothetical protein
MKAQFGCHWAARVEEMFGPPRYSFAFRISCTVFMIACWMVLATLAAAQNLHGEPTVGTDAQSCAALAELNLENAAGGPALVTSARLIDVPATGLERWLPVDMVAAELEAGCTSITIAT